MKKEEKGWNNPPSSRGGLNMTQTKITEFKSNLSEEEARKRKDERLYRLRAYRYGEQLECINYVDYL